jgi:TolB protein
MINIFRTIQAYLLGALLIPILISCGGGESDRVNRDTIVFLSDRDQTERKFDIFLYEDKKDKLTNLTLEKRDLIIRSSSSPRINHKRNSVLFFAYNPQRLVELDLVSKQLRNLVEIQYSATSYILTPDGNSVIYTESPDSNKQLVKLDLMSNERVNLSSNDYNNFEPCCSHDGKKIIYVTDQDGSMSIAVMDSDGKNQTVLTNEFGDDRFPNICPENKQVVFCSSRGGKSDSDYDLYTIEITGKNMKLLYDSNAYDTNPIYSPDKKQLGFISNIRGRLFSDIYLFELSTQNLTLVTEQLKYFNQNFVFSPDNQFILFENMRPADSQILAYKIDEKRLEKIIPHEGRDISPSL